ncbi:MAG TPA: 1-(5-phosphoribosyl)-5-[(5-phosphoribosylamino)methylideneamino] imidazole-4-carboxamide isomerase [Ignavibacteriaceae bacterium]|nr:1-(5-phosphoribosyl)-5-[(5-phosphoribosylamino)methylideneamino] imidazole-4-carboxamide isomerase [Ignavibacteriaceae bacterium]
MRKLLVIPSIDIKDRKTIRIVQGIPELDCLEYGSDPVEMARIWRTENAKLLHVVDFNGAKDHTQKNYPIVKEICNSVIIPVQFAGGIRNLEDADVAMDLGISRLSISTMALENPTEFERVFNKYGPSKICVSLDIIETEVITRGRRFRTGINYLDFAKRMADMGVERFIVTDVMRNGVLGGPNIRLSRDVAEVTGGKVTLSGGIRNKDELLDVQRYITVGIDSVIIGRALYENKFPCQKLWRVAESGIFH